MWNKINIITFYSNNINGMKNYFVFLIFSLSLLMMSCKTKDIAFNPDTYDDAVISFGSGGGFTGMVKTFYLTKNGNLYTAVNNQYELIGKVDKKVNNQIFTNYNALGLDKLSMDTPGNKYYFINFKSKDTSNVIQWGKNPLEDKNLSIFYNILLDLVKKLSPQEF